MPNYDILFTFLFLYFLSCSSRHYQHCNNICKDSAAAPKRYYNPDQSNDCRINIQTLTNSTADTTKHSIGITFIQCLIFSFQQCDHCNNDYNPNDQSCKSKYTRKHNFSHFLYLCSFINNLYYKPLIFLLPVKPIPIQLKSGMQCKAIRLLPMRLR